MPKFRFSPSHSSVSEADGLATPGMGVVEIERRSISGNATQFPSSDHATEIAQTSGGNAKGPPDGGAFHRIIALLSFALRFTTTAL